MRVAHVDVDEIPFLILALYITDSTVPHIAASWWISTEKNLQHDKKISQFSNP